MIGSSTWAPPESLSLYCHFIIRLKCNQCIKYKQRSTAVDDGKSDAIGNIRIREYFLNLSKKKRVILENSKSVLDLRDS